MPVQYNQSQRPRSNCSKYNAKGGMRFAFPPYGLILESPEQLESLYFMLTK